MSLSAPKTSTTGLPIECAMDLSNDASELYIDLMKKCLTRFIFGDQLEDVMLRPELIRVPLRPAYRLVSSLLRQKSLVLARKHAFNRELRSLGQEWAPGAETMIGLKRLDNIQACVKDVLANNVAGDFIETGVWRGGAVIFMRALLQAYGVKDRVVYVADSFKGLPPPDTSQYPQDEGDWLSTVDYLRVSLEQVKSSFANYGLLDDQVRFLEGWFKDTLPSAPMEKLAIMRLDGDMYESTMEALVHLYAKLSPGGYCIIDDYGAIPACRQAVHDFRGKHSISEPIVEIDWTGRFWKKAQG